MSLIRTSSIEKYLLKFSAAREILNRTGGRLESTADCRTFIRLIILTSP